MIGTRHKFLFGTRKDRTMTNSNENQAVETKIYKWIARDNDDDLYIYEDDPIFDNDTGYFYNHSHPYIEHG